MNSPTASSAQNAKTARKIPVSRYTSKQWQTLESERLWTRVWQIACTEDTVPAAGDYWVYEIASLSVILMRDEAGELQGFQNVCPHRGTKLLEGSGDGLKHIQCVYHGWAFDLQGARCPVSETGEIGEGREGSIGLIPVAVDSWGGLVFINIDVDCEPLPTFLEQLPEQLAWLGMEDFSCSQFMSFRLKANWKVVIDAFIETYHLHHVHPQMTAIADDVNTPITLFDRHTMFMQPYGVPSPRRQGSVSDQELWEEFIHNLGHRLGLTYAATQEPGEHPQVPDGKTMRDVLVAKIRENLATMGSRYDQLDDNHVIDDFHYHIFPNAVFNFFAGWFGLILARPGATPDECIVDVWNFDLLAEDAPNQHPRPVSVELVGDELRALGPVFMQDLDVMARAQKGLRQPGMTHMKLTAAEARIGRLHEILDRYIQPETGLRLPE